MEESRSTSARSGRHATLPTPSPTVTREKSPAAAMQVKRRILALLDDCAEPPGAASAISFLHDSLAEARGVRGVQSTQAGKPLVLKTSLDPHILRCGP